MEYQKLVKFLEDNCVDKIIKESDEDKVNSSPNRVGEVCCKHGLKVSEFNLGSYSNGFLCDQCNTSCVAGSRYHCAVCGLDVCNDCKPLP